MSHVKVNPLHVDMLSNTNAMKGHGLMGREMVRKHRSEDRWILQVRASPAGLPA